MLYNKLELKNEIDNFYYFLIHHRLLLFYHIVPVDIIKFLKLYPLARSYFKIFFLKEVTNDPIRIDN